MRRFLILALLLSCGSKDGDDGDGGGGDDGGCSTEDVDGDGLDECAELDLGTDPDAADTDGDGYDDAEEIDCVSDPLDADEACYACGWPHNDPGTLEATGDEEGDTIANIEFWDQCGEEVELWDFSGEYHILFMTAEW
jgi:hypothetical protein